MAFIEIEIPHNGLVRAVRVGSGESSFSESSTGSSPPARRFDDELGEARVGVVCSDDVLGFGQWQTDPVFAAITKEHRLVHVVLAEIVLVAVLLASEDARHLTE
jgi:hypothetical protein